jgi:hypothetical protein
LKPPIRPTAKRAEGVRSRQIAGRARCPLYPPKSWRRRKRAVSEHNLTIKPFNGLTFYFRFDCQRAPDAIRTCVVRRRFAATISPPCRNVRKAPNNYTIYYLSQGLESRRQKKSRKTPRIAADRVCVERTCLFRRKRRAAAPVPCLHHSHTKLNHSTQILFSRPKSFFRPPGYRTTRTGQPARRTTSSVVLPSIACFSPVRP